MASSAIAPTANGTMDEARAAFEIKELRKIVELKDRIMAGRHPKYKVPASTLRKVSLNGTVPAQPSLDTASPVTTSAIGIGKRVTSSHSSSKSSPQTPSIGTTPRLASITKQQDRVSLNESNDAKRAADHLKAQLKMKRIEKMLKEQADQEQAKSFVLTPEAIPDFDVSEVLAKALHHVSTGTEVGVAHSVGTVDAPPSGARSVSDSFDDNTFYSSQPDSSTNSLVSSNSKGQEGAQKKGQVVTTNSTAKSTPITVRSKVAVTEDVQIRGSYSPGEILSDEDLEILPRPAIVKLPSHAVSHTPSQVVVNDGHHKQSHTPAQYGKDFVDITYSESEVEEIDKPSEAQRPVSVNSSPLTQTIADNILVKSTTDELIRDTFPGEPEVLAQAASLLAPQSDPINPLTVATPSGTSSAPATVAHTRPSKSKSKVTKPTQDVPTTDITIKRISGGRQETAQERKQRKKDEKKTSRAELKKNKKTKRKEKAQDIAVVSPRDPFIKAEPLSPSPNVTANLPRPQKRQRPNPQPEAAGLDYDEPPARNDRHEQANRPPQQQEPPRPPYLARRGEGRMHEDIGSPYSTSRRPPRIDTQTYGTPGRDHRPVQTSNTYSTYPSAVETRTGRAGSVMIVDDSPQGGPRYYREPPLRHSIRPTIDRERSRSPVIYVDDRTSMVIAPPVRQRRIVVDEYGQQFYAPEPTPVRVVSRQSMAPPVYRDDGMVYEQPPRAAARPVEEMIERDGVLYRRVSPTANTPMGPPRRVVTQPTYEVDYRAYREREYSVRPMAPPSAYMQPVETVARRQMSHFEGPTPIQYVDYRRSSVRPETRMSVAPQVEYMTPSTPAHGGVESLYGGPRSSVRRMPHGQYESPRTMY